MFNVEDAQVKLLHYTPLDVALEAALVCTSSDDQLEEMEDILRKVAPEELTRARAYWMAHIDGALLNRNGWMGRSLINLEDTIANLEEEEEE